MGQHAPHTENGRRVQVELVRKMHSYIPEYLCVCVCGSVRVHGALNSPCVGTLMLFRVFVFLFSPWNYCKLQNQEGRIVVRAVHKNAHVPYMISVLSRVPVCLLGVVGSSRAGLTFTTEIPIPPAVPPPPPSSLESFRHNRRASTGVAAMCLPFFCLCSRRRTSRAELIIRPFAPSLLPYCTADSSLVLVFVGSVFVGCFFTRGRWRCDPQCSCEYKYRFGDYTPGRSCRLRPEEERGLLSCDPEKGNDVSLLEK